MFPEKMHLQAVKKKVCILANSKFDCQVDVFMDQIGGGNFEIDV